MIKVLVTGDAPYEAFTNVCDVIVALEKKLKPMFSISVPLDERKLAIVVPSIGIAGMEIKRLREMGALEQQ